MTKDYRDRVNQKPVGIGTSFEDLKTNSVISKFQRENVWHPYYELDLEGQMDFKEKMIAAAQEKNLKNVGGQVIEALKQKLIAHDEGVKISDQAKKQAELGLVPKKAFNIKDKLADLKRQAEEEDMQQVIDPYTVKVNQVNSNVIGEELYEIMVKYGEVRNVKIPKD